MTAASMVVSVTLAAVTTAASGSPPPSQTRCSLLPGLPRSTGFAPTWSPTLGAHAHGVHAGPRPVQPILLAEPVQDLEVELVEHARGRPLGQAAPAGRRRAAAKLTGGKQPPRGRGAGHVHDRGEAGPVGDGTAPAPYGGAVGPAARAPPAPIARPAPGRQQVSSWRGIMPDQPKGTKRRHTYQLHRGARRRQQLVEQRTRPDNPSAAASPPPTPTHRSNYP
jgi:hypothetical protein